MCPQDKQASVGDMTMETLATIASQLTEEVKYIQFYFVGEPTVHPRLIEMIKYLRQSTTAKIEISTNLVALGRRKNAEAFLISGVNRVLCCIEGASQTSHQALRSTGNFAQALEVVHHLAEMKHNRALDVEIVVKCIETIYNQFEAALFMDYWKQVPGITAVCSWMNTWAGTMPTLQGVGLRGAPNANSPRVACAEIWNKLVVRWDGTVVLCCHDWASTKSLGHAHEVALVDIWNSEAANHIRKEHLQGQFRDICACCVEWSIAQELITDYEINAKDIVWPEI